MKFNLSFFCIPASFFIYFDTFFFFFFFLGDPSHIKIIDFGFSKNCERTQSFLGTHGYLAPEMMAHEEYTTAVDMWALGVCAYALLSGYLPFDEMEPPEPG